MKMGFQNGYKVIAVAALAMMFGAGVVRAQVAGTAPASATPLAASTIPTANLVQPEEMARLVNLTGAERPRILQVGSRVMFDQAHIPGSEYAGPGAKDDGLNALRERVKTLPKNSFMVLYCGCCPWGRCPNVGNAFKTLMDMGFTNVKVLYIADNFGTNWVSKGYPVAQ